MTLSRWKANSSLEQAQKVVKKRWWVWRHIPFIEMICLTWEASFNSSSMTDTVWLWIVTSKNRMWSSLIRVHILHNIMNYFLTRAELPAFKIFAVQAEDSLDIQMIKEKQFDIIPIYQLAHLSVLYRKFDTFSRSIFDQNSWVQDYLPNFPNQFIIWTWVEIVSWKSKLSRLLESLLSWILWDISEFIAKKMAIYSFVLYKIFKNTNLRIIDNLVRRDYWNKQKISLSWKVTRKWIQENWHT